MIIKIHPFCQGKIYEGAIDYFDKAVKTNKHDPISGKACYYKGVAYEKLKKYDEAIESYTEALQLDAYIHDAYFNRAALERKAGKYEEAMNDYNKVLEEHPRNVEALCHRGELRYDLDEYKGAIEDLDKVIELEPSA